MLLRREDGFSAIEIVIVSALMLLALGAVATTMVVSLKTQSFGSRESQGLDGARLALVQLERDVRASVIAPVLADAAGGCVPGKGACLLLRTRTPTGVENTYRYRLDGSSFVRERLDLASGAYVEVRSFSDQIANLTQSPKVPVFTCSGQLVSIDVALLVRPDKDRDETFSIGTTLRARNSYTTC